MRHPDPETLALSALGEDVLADDARAHVLACDACHDEVESLRRTVDAVRGAPTPRVSVETLPQDESAPPPPPRVWQGIAAELGLGGDPPATGPGPSPETVLPAPSRRAPAAPAGRRDRSTRPFPGNPPTRPGPG
ncbi:MAG: hypothetical protein ACFCVG_06985, partial [Kineosporiaceae bacterium]